MRTRERILNHLIYRQFQKALTEYSMLADGDRILIGLSGGKDSLCLLDMLSRRQRIFKPQIEVEAVHVRMKNIHYESDTSYLKRFANEHGVKLHIVTTEFRETEKTDKPACFLCSWHRRKSLFASLKKPISIRLLSAIIWTTSFIPPCSTNSIKAHSLRCLL